MSAVYAKYLARVGKYLLVGLLAATLLNAFVDPFGVIAAGWGDHSAFHRTEAAEYAREAKLVAVDAIRPRTLILGSSTAFNGIPADSALWRARPVYNLAVGGATIQEIEWLLKYAYASGRVRQVIVNLDFYMFNMRNPTQMTPPGRGLAARLLRYFELMSSRAAFVASLETLATQRTTNCVVQLNGDELCHPRAATQGGYLRAFQLTESSYLTNNTWFAQGSGFDFRDAQGESSFNAYRRILEFAADHRIDLRITLSPSHARLWTALRLAGLEDAFQAWKERLVAIDLAVARGAGRPSFPFWDFSYATPLTVELIAAGPQKMNYFLETMHFTSTLGTKMLERVFDAPDQDRTFGRRLDDSATPAVEIADEARLQSDWERNPGVIQDLEALARDSAGFRSRLVESGRVSRESLAVRDDGL